MSDVAGLVADVVAWVVVVVRWVVIVVGEASDGVDWVVDADA